MRNSTQPTKKQRATTKSGVSSLVYSMVRRDMSEVGPIDTSLIVPNTTYTKQPINAEFSPYCDKPGLDYVRKSKYSEIS